MQTGWLGRQDSNLGSRDQSPLPYRAGRRAFRAPETWLIETVAQLVRAGTFFIPASLGATEAAMVLVYEALVGAPSLGFAVALIRRARELLWIAWGLWLGWLEVPGAATAALTSETAGATGAVTWTFLMRLLHPRRA